MIEKTRGLNFFDPDKYTPTERLIEIIGAGGIGSPLAETLATMGFDLTIWDKDIVEAHNISNQNYYPDQIGECKVKALLDTLIRKTCMSGDQISPNFIRSPCIYSSCITDKENPNNKQTFIMHDEFFTERSKLTGSVLVLATDSIESRTMAYNLAKDSFEDKGTPHTVIDGRLGGEYYQVFYVDMTNEKSRRTYEKTLFAPQDAVDLPCTGKSIMYIASHIAGQIAYYVKESVIHSDRKHIECVYDFNEQINIFNGCIVAFGGDTNA
jgi:hypothetical protein